MDSFVCSNFELRGKENQSVFVVGLCVNKHDVSYSGQGNGLPLSLASSYTVPGWDCVSPCVGSEELLAHLCQDFAAFARALCLDCVEVTTPGEFPNRLRKAVLAHLFLSYPNFVGPLMAIDSCGYSLFAQEVV